MTYQEIITEVTNRIHDTSDDIITRVKSWINFAYQEIWSRKNWTFSLRSGVLTTTAGTLDYGLSDEVEQIIDIRDATGEAKLGLLSWSEFDNAVPNPTDQSNPSFYIPSGVLGVRDQLGVTASTVGLVSNNSADTSTQVVFVYGLVSGVSQVESVPLNGTASTSTAATFSRVDRIVKATTSVGVIRAFANTSSAGIACTFSAIRPDALATEYPHVSIYPMGASTLSYRYKKRAFEMVQTSDVPELPTVRHEALVYGALVRAGEYMNSSQLPQWQAKYEMMIDSMKKDDTPSTEIHMRVRSDRETSTSLFPRLSRSMQMTTQTTVTAATATLYAQTSAVSISNTTTESSLMGSGSGSLILPANFFAAGASIRLNMSGFYNTKSSGAGTLNIKVKLGSTTIISTGAQTVEDGLSSMMWHIRPVTITSRAAGATGTVLGQGEMVRASSSYGIVIDDMAVSGSSGITIDTTTAQTLDVTATWSVADSSNSISCISAVLESLTL